MSAFSAEKRALPAALVSRTHTQSHFATPLPPLTVNYPLVQFAEDLVDPVNDGVTRPLPIPENLFSSLIPEAQPHAFRIPHSPDNSGRQRREGNSIP